MSYKILIIDDEPTIQESIEDVLLDHFRSNITITKKNNAIDFENVLAEEIYDVVFIDMKMPGISGVDALKKYLKSEKVNMPKAIIAMSGLFTSEDTFQTKYNIASLIKPIDIEKLISLVETVVPKPVKIEMEPFEIDEEMVDSFKDEIESVLKELKTLDEGAQKDNFQEGLFQKFDQLIFGVTGTAAMFEFNDLNAYLNIHSKILRQSADSKNPKVRKKTLRLVNNVIEMFECLIPSLGNMDELNKQRLKMGNETKIANKFLSEMSRMA